MTDDAALLAAIRAYPAEDVPRLAYADWLDENRQPARAEFIRVQCELARLLEGHREGEWRCRSPKKSTRPDLARIGEYEACGTCDVCAPRIRERYLLKRNWQEWFPWATTFGTNTARVEMGGEVQVENNHTTIAHIWFARGFADDATLPAEKWVEHGDAIVAANLVEEVTLTTWPEWSTQHDRDINSTMLRLVGREQWHDIPFSGTRASRDGIMKRLLSAEWRTVKTWNLPPARVERNAGTYTRLDWPSDLTADQILDGVRSAREAMTRFLNSQIPRR